MSKELTIHGEALGASQQGTLAVEQFLKDNYLFRFNELSGKVECVTLPSDDKPVWQVLTQKALNSIIIRAKREQICEKGSPKTDIGLTRSRRSIPSRIISRICPNGTDRTMWRVSSGVCLV